ncbi:hypothetical protein CLOSTHATH_01982 [Hungatella hathewayi DSM 13479]|jgi:hypothetical protein|uniref:Uncharacterized protein n=1 Tax=Hungatella hathewayi DSM 13479 TaxID=566550 RepID=D3AEF1_9FIRM|nr:hypothetical protein CLOSTHATH_01982 [Hungatella hathewayi DSM 13479]
MMLIFGQRRLPQGRCGLKFEIEPQRAKPEKVAFRKEGVD